MIFELPESARLVSVQVEFEVSGDEVLILEIQAAEARRKDQHR